MKKVRGSKVVFSTIEITSKEVRENNVDFSTIRTISKKVRGNKADFLTIQITSKKVRGSKVDFSTIEITSIKVRGTDVDFLISKITSKKYVKMTWNFVEIWSPTYRRNIHVKSTSIRRGGPAGFKSNSFQLKLDRTALFIKRKQWQNLSITAAIIMAKRYSHANSNISHSGPCHVKMIFKI